MRRTVFLLMFLASGIVAIDAGAQEPHDTDPAPDYRTLYEEGFYQEAITLIDHIVSGDSACGREPLRYLAFCHIARGDREQGENAFERLLDCDPQFRCDSLFTSPKILDVFNGVLERHLQKQSLSDRGSPADTLSAISPDTTAVSAPPALPDSSLIRPAAAPGALPTPDEAAISVSVATHRLPVRYLPAFLPGGGGQFMQRQWIKGALFLAVQAAAAGGYVWAYHTRQSYYDPVYGWSASRNETAYNRYTSYARLGFGVCIGTYTFSVIDYFWTVRKQNASR